MFLVLDDATATTIQQRRQDTWNNNSQPGSSGTNGAAAAGSGAVKRGYSTGRDHSTKPTSQSQPPPSSGSRGSKSAPEARPHGSSKSDKSSKVSVIVDKFSRGTKRPSDGKSGSPAKHTRR